MNLTAEMCRAARCWPSRMGVCSTSGGPCQPGPNSCSSR